MQQEPNTISKVGRPTHQEHRCGQCLKIYKNSAALSQHKYQAKQGKVKCSPQNEHKQFSNSTLFATPIGPHSKSVMNLTTSRYQHQEEKQQSRPSSQTKVSTTVETIKNTLTGSPEWNQIEDLFASGTFILPQQFSKTYAEAFLYKGTAFENKSPAFAVALCKILEQLNIQTLSKHLLEPYQDFFVSFVPTEDYKGETLRNLYNFARTINASLNWLLHLENPIGIISKEGWISSDPQIECGRIFAEQRWLYSCSYFDVVDLIMASHHTCTCIYEKLENYFALIQQQQINDTTISKDQILRYCGYDRRHGYETLETWVQNLESEAQHSFSNQQMICLLGFCGKYSYDAVKKASRSLELNADVETIAELIESIVAKEKEYEQFIEQQQKKKAAEEEQKRIAAEQEQQRIAAEQQRLQQEQERLQEQEEKQRQDEEAQRLRVLELYHQLCAANKLQQLDDAAFLEFADQIKGIAAELPKPITPRAEQLALMFLFVTCGSRTRLAQLPTGTGKSLMFGLLARYFNLQGRKVAVIVPNEVLAAIQQDMYCPWASRAHDKLFEQESICINYCIYEDFLTARIPFNTICLVDEVDALFFSDTPKLEGNKFISAILLLNKYQVIGMSATFRGEQGSKWLQHFLKGSNTVSVNNAVPERILDIDVFGKLSAIQLKAKVIEVAKAKQQELPVVIILPTLEECKQLAEEFVNSVVFGLGRVPEQVSCAEEIRNTQNCPVVLTTSVASLGMDFTSRAYVIQTELPYSWSVFLQNAGRSNRVDVAAPLQGALITSSFVSDIASVKKGCEYEQQRANLFRADYFQCLEMLEKCANIDTSLAAFTNAKQLFEQKKTATEIRVALFKSLRFKQALQSGFQEPAPVSTIGKRCTPEKSQQNIEKAIHTNPRKILHPFFSKFPQNTQKVSKKEEDLDLMLEEKKQSQNQVEEDQELISVDLDEKSVLNPDFIQQQEFQQYKQLQRKFGKSTPSCSDADHSCSSSSNEHERTDSEILFGNNNPSPHNNKKREHKREQKDIDRESIKSGVSGVSKVSRSSNGRFEGKYKVGDKSGRSTIKQIIEDDWQFIRRDEKGNKVYQCLNCQKQPVRGDHRKVHSCKK